MENISPSNLKLLINFYNSNNVDENHIIDYYKPIGGYLYCLYNPMYKFYSENMKKCGNTIDFDKRIYQYTTSYLEESQYLLKSEQYLDKTFAETLLFHHLKDYRMKNTREFFDCDIDIIKNAFEKVKCFFQTHNTKKKIFRYMIKNYDMFFNFPNLFQEENYELHKEKILLSKDISDDEFNIINKKILTFNEINEVDKYAHIKYKFKNFWNFKEVNKNNLDEYIGQEQILNRFFYLTSKKMINNNEIIDINIDNKTKIIKNIINTLGFDLTNLNLKISREQFYLNVQSLLDEDNEFKKNYANIRKLFGKDKHELNDKLKGSALVKLLNGFLNEFGFELLHTHSTKKIDDKTKFVYFYKLIIIKKYICYI